MAKSYPEIDAMNNLVFSIFIIEAAIKICAKGNFPIKYAPAHEPAFVLAGTFRGRARVATRPTPSHAPRVPPTHHFC